MKRLETKSKAWRNSVPCLRLVCISKARKASLVAHDTARRTTFWFDNETDGPINASESIPGPPRFVLAFASALKATRSESQLSGYEDIPNYSESPNKSLMRKESFWCFLSLHNGNKSRVIESRQNERCRRVWGEQNRFFKFLTVFIKRRKA